MEFYILKDNVMLGYHGEMHILRIIVFEICTSSPFQPRLLG